MKKTALSLAVLGAFAANSAVAAPEASANASGFADIIYTAVDEASDVVGGKNSTEGKFGANAEIDFSATVGAVTGRIDVDLDLATDAQTGGNSGRIEQAFFAWGVSDNVTLIGGVFNNPIGHEAEDAPDKNFTSSGLVYSVLDHQTALNGNNITGVAAAANFGMVTVTGAFLNDLQQVDEENSFALVANLTPIEGLDLELGYVSQADNTDNPLSAEDVIDFNAQYTISGFTAGIDYLSAGAIVDSTYDAWGGYAFGDFAVKARYSVLAYEVAANEDLTKTTLYASWQANSNLLVALEWSNNEKGGTASDIITGMAGDNDIITAEFIVTL
ncbi:MAG: hypothetical protein GXP14_05785 [Gammaproteobacteria bacterium]|nr:hypothetical protein [Gammaproteobacteria bacterium]